MAKEYANKVKQCCEVCKKSVCRKHSHKTSGVTCSNHEFLDYRYRCTRRIQSGFRKGHSTETPLLRLLSDVYAAIDSSQLTLLALFDVSAAFDTVDHEILLKRLNVY